LPTSQSASHSVRAQTESDRPGAVVVALTYEHRELLVYVDGLAHRCRDHVVRWVVSSGWFVGTGGADPSPRTRTYRSRPHPQTGTRTRSRSGRSGVDSRTTQSRTVFSAIWKGSVRRCLIAETIRNARSHPIFSDLGSSEAWHYGRRSKRIPKDASSSAIVSRARRFGRSANAMGSIALPGGIRSSASSGMSVS